MIFSILLAGLLVLAAVASDYFPISDGYRWVYKSYSYDGMFQCFDTMGIYKDSVSGSDHYFEYCDDHCYNTIGKTCGYIYSLNDTVFGLSGFPVFYHAYRDGSLFLQGTGERDTIRYIGHVAVPAGDFDSCYYQPNQPNMGLIIAPNVGLIKVMQGDATILELYWTNTPTSVDAMAARSNNVTKIHIYPNPSHGAIFISDIPVQSSYVLDIYDIGGRLAYHKIGAKDNTRRNVGFCAIAPGIYLCRLKTGQNDSKVKIVVTP